MKRTETWTCQACPNSPSTNKADFLEHMRSVHKYEKTPSKRSLVQAVDGSDWYSNVFEWTIPTPDGVVNAVQVSSGERSADDPMRFTGDENS